jgi:hypothetical protein
MTVTATDADLPAQTLSYSIVGGADAAKFSINASTGALASSPLGLRSAHGQWRQQRLRRHRPGFRRHAEQHQAIAVTVTPVNDNTRDHQQRRPASPRTPRP